MFAALVYGDDITVPVPTGGSIIIQHPEFIIHQERNQFNIETYDPTLTFVFIDKTSPAIESVKIRFDMGGVCNGEIRQWSEVVTLPLVFMAQEGWRNYTHQIESLNGVVQGCRTEIIKARAGEPPPPPLDLRAEVETAKAKRESDEAAAAKAKSAADAARAEAEAAKIARMKEQDAADAAREKRLADEQKKRDDAAKAAQRAKDDAARAAEEARAEAIARQARAVCAQVYKSTADKKISDLTVREAQQVQSCQNLDMYPPTQ